MALSVALPPAFSGPIIASRFQVYAQTGTSSLAVSVIGFVVAAPAWISPARLVGGRAMGANWTDRPPLRRAMLDAALSQNT